MLKPPFSWYGGKQKLAKFVIGHMPRHDVYIEPFGGAASVLLAKPTVKLETYNDLNRGVVNFYRCLRNGSRLDWLTEQLQLSPHSRFEFIESRRYIESLPANDCDWDHAYHWYNVAWQCFGGSICRDRPSWGFLNSTNASGTRQKVRYFSELHERIKHVQIECDDALKIINRSYGAGTLIYCDPPYHDETCDADYAHKTDHTKLIELLLKSDAMVMLSGFEHESYNVFEKSGWVCVKIKRAITSNVVKLNHQQNRTYKTECLWINPAAYQNLEGGLGVFG
jgi:DNA adenine methylase